MTKLKMGMHNAITPERFACIRRAIAEGMGDKEVMSRYNIKLTTLKRIKSSDTFYAYRVANEKLPRAKNMPTVICAVAGVPYEDFGSKKRPVKQGEQNSQNANGYNVTENTVEVVVVSLVALVAILGIVFIICNAS